MANVRVAIVRKKGVADVTKRGVADVTKKGVANVRMAYVPTPYHQNYQKPQAHQIHQNHETHQIRQNLQNHQIAHPGTWVCSPRGRVFSRSTQNFVKWISNFSHSGQKFDRWWCWQWRRWPWQSGGSWRRGGQSCGSVQVKTPVSATFSLKPTHLVVEVKLVSVGKPDYCSGCHFLSFFTQANANVTESNLTGALKWNKFHCYTPVCHKKHTIYKRQQHKLLCFPPQKLGSSKDHNDDGDDNGFPANSHHGKIPPWWEYDNGSSFVFFTMMMATHICMCINACMQYVVSQNRWKSAFCGWITQ